MVVNEDVELAVFKTVAELYASYFDYKGDDVRRSIIQVAQEATDAFAERQKRLRPPQSEAARQFRGACVEFGRRRARRVFLRYYIRAAAAHFAAGAKREARRYYDGAFLFADQNVIREALLKSCAKAAGEAYKAGNHDAVWFLFDAVFLYAPADTSRETIFWMFSREGVEKKKLRRKPQNIPQTVLV